MMRPVLILRPEPGASATALRTEGLGLQALVRPLFETRAVDWDAPDPASCDAIMMTSANAARFGGDRLSSYRHLRLYAVGEPTAEAAKAAGFDTVITGNADQAALIRDMDNAGCHDVIYLAGRDRTAMGEAPFQIRTVTVYASDTLPAPAIPADCIALLHSARAARRLAEITPDRASIAIIAISPTVAAAAGEGWQSVATAETPQDAAMLALAASLCETPSE